MERGENCGLIRQFSDYFLAGAAGETVSYYFMFSTGRSLNRQTHIISCERSTDNLKYSNLEWFLLMEILGGDDLGGIV